jgi:bile acid-coenzyme A ligase
MGQTLVLLERFDALAALSAIEAFRINFAALVPTMMLRMSDVDGFDTADLSSLSTVFHTAAPCPDWLRRRWIDRIGGEHLIEGYGATEPVGSTQIRGDEWLAHPGSVGRAWRCDIAIRDDQGVDLPAGETGTIHMRPHGVVPQFQYLGQSNPRPTSDGYYTVGDLGYLDDDGYLYIADRRVDMIVTGGANVYPAEVEAVLLSHEDVADAVVVGIADHDWGRRVHAVVVLKANSAPDAAKLQEFARSHLAGYKVPKSFDFVDALPRNEAGKVRRTEIGQEATRRAVQHNGASR